MADFKKTIATAKAKVAKAEIEAFKARLEALDATLAELPSSETWLVGHQALRAVPRVAAVWTFLMREFASFEPKG